MNDTLGSIPSTEKKKVLPDEKKKKGLSTVFPEVSLIFQIKKGCFQRKNINITKMKTTMAFFLWLYEN
jgi:hypothetical protein